MELTKQQTEDLLGLLVGDLDYSRYALQEAYARSKKAENRDAFFNTIFTNALVGGVIKVSILREILEKNISLELKASGKEILSFWLLMKEKYEGEFGDDS